METLIKEIHNSDIFGCFIETGCGVPVASLLLSVAGASKTVYMTECPYSKEFANNKYDNNSVRAVSAENIQKFIHGNILAETNTTYASSFQVGEYNSISTHGWIGLQYKTTCKYYHISIHQSLTREEYIKRIGEIGIKLIHARNVDIPQDCDVDIVLDENLEYDFESTLKFISLNSNEQFTIFSKNKIDRLESITRDKSTIVIFKGSFNPLTNSHLEIVKNCGEMYDTKPHFMISFNAIQKGFQDVESLLFRIKVITELGFSVIISNKPYFKQGFDFLRQKFQGKVVYAMGLDTVIRLMWDYEQTGLEQAYKDFDNAEIVVTNRNGTVIPDFLNENNQLFKFIKDFDKEMMELSSTQVRESVKNGNLEHVKKNVPSQVFEMIKNQYK